jgi:hypothetical protein
MFSLLIAYNGILKLPERNICRYTDEIFEIIFLVRKNKLLCV